MTTNSFGIRDRLTIGDTTYRDRGFDTSPTTSRHTAQGIEFDLASVEPSIAGPKRPQDWIPLAQAAHTIRMPAGRRGTCARAADRARRGVGQVVPRERPDLDQPDRPGDSCRPRRRAIWAA